jgi:hypothetical protein
MAQTPDNPIEPTNQPQPGTVISPGGAPVTPPSTPEPTEPVTPEVPSAEPEPMPAAEAIPDESPVLTPPETEPPTSRSEPGTSQITWTASEFVAHNKSPGWYVMLVVATVVLSVIVYVLNRDFISVGVVIVAGVIMGVYAGHQPRQLEYILNSQGFGIGQKQYSFTEFKSFSVQEEGAFSSIVFMPLKRLGPAITIYYAPEDEDNILAILTSQLPMEEHRADAVDTLMRRIRF